MPDKNKTSEAHAKFIEKGEAFHFLSQPQASHVFEREAFSFENASALFTQLFGVNFNFDRFFDLAFEEIDAS